MRQHLKIAGIVAGFILVYLLVVEFNLLGFNFAMLMLLRLLTFLSVLMVVIYRYAFQKLFAVPLGTGILTGGFLLVGVSVDVDPLSYMVWLVILIVSLIYSLILRYVLQRLHLKKQLDKYRNRNM